ncbi:MAG: hypothetical protein B6I25_05820 [Planctomycetales bacterium 4572_13]|nr:MAG: hypothetical protein B6I25_05820 [Planctomycetales bacterium 4572_13]
MARCPAIRAATTAVSSILLNSVCDSDIEILSFRLDKLFSETYCSGIMTEYQTTNSKNRKLSLPARLVAAGVFFAIITVFCFLRASSNGAINMSYWFGVCGFKQRFSLPCPGCGWTHAAEVFAAGQFLQAFKIQPAAAFFCIVLSLVAIFALHRAVFGVNSRLLQRISSSIGVGVLLAVACVVILTGWMVNLIRTILGN